MRIHANIEDRPGRYEIFQSGFWIIYEVDRTGGEIIIRLANIEEN